MKSIQEWIKEGEELHASVLQELQELEVQIADLEQRRMGKLAEVNQIAGIIGKPAADAGRRLIAHGGDEHPGVTLSTSSATIARALAGKGIPR